MSRTIETSLVSASALLKHYKRQLPALGETLIFNYLNQTPKSTASTQTEKIFNAVTLKVNERTTLISNTGFGSAMLAFYFELALTVGVKEFYILGQAGALEGSGESRPAEFRPGEYIKPTSAVSAHSAGHEYHDEDEFVRRPHQDMAHSKLIEAALKVTEARVWSTDAMFRETPSAVDANYDLGARAVEMETSTLFALGAHFNIPVTSYLVISDLVSAKSGWQPGFADITSYSKKLIEAVCSAL